MASLSPPETPGSGSRSRSRSRSFTKTLNVAAELWRTISNPTKKSTADEWTIHIGTGSGAVQAASNRLQHNSAFAQALVKTGSMGTAITMPSPSRKVELSIDTGMAANAVACEPPTSFVSPDESQADVRALQTLSRLFDFNEHDVGDTISISDQQSVMSDSEGEVARDFIVNVKVYVKNSDNTINQRALLDTGTFVNLMSESFARETQWPIDPLPGSVRPLICGNGSEFRPHGLISVELYFANRVLRGTSSHRIKFFVCPDSAPFEVLLGRQFISTAKLLRYNDLSLVLHPKTHDKAAQAEREKLQRVESEKHRESDKEKFEKLRKRRTASTDVTSGQASSSGSGNQEGQKSSTGTTRAEASTAAR